MRKRKGRTYAPPGGKTDGQIAREMGISREMVGIIRRRVMKKLEKWIREDKELLRSFGFLRESE